MNKSIEGDSVLDDHTGVKLPVTVNLSEIVSGDVVRIIDLSYEEIVSMRGFLEHMYGKAMYENILEKYILNSKSVVSFSDFCEFYDIRINFSLFFTLNYIGDMYRVQLFYKKYARENPKQDKYLRDNGNNPEIAEEYIHHLYQAYTTMIQYDEVSSNRDLFSLNIAKHIFELNL